MSGYKRVSFYELCRLCASSIQKEKTHIFQEDGRKIELQSKIQSCLSLTVNEDDCLPKVVCIRCVKQLDNCYTFREECLISESMLSTYFKNFRYTDDFKKSGKVYIKDTKPQSVPSTNEGPTSTTNNVNPPIPTTNHVKTNEHPVEPMPFYTFQLPTIVPTQNINSKLVKNDLADGKISQQVNTQNQVACNLNLLNSSSLKNSLPLITKDMISNIIVNSNGEVLTVAQIRELESLGGQFLLPKPKKSSKTKKKHEKTITSNASEENIIKIDLTAEDNNYNILNKYDKLPHIKSTVNARYEGTHKPEKNINSQTVIFPVSEYQNNYNYNTLNNTYSQPTSLPIQNNTNLITNSNVICNSSSVDSLAINLNLQELQNSYTVISSNPNALPNNTISSNNPSYSTNANIDHASSLNIPQSNASSLNVPQNNGAHVITHISNNSTCQSQSHPDPLIQMQQDVTPQHIINESKKIVVNNTENIIKNENSNNVNHNNNNNNGSKTHVCESCHKGFKRREHLYQHVKLHTGFRPYQCDICSKSFMRKEHLFRHSTLHSGQKNFACDTCGKSFSRNDNLLKHKKTHDKQSSYTCEICHKVFVMKHYYQAHRQSHGSKCYISSPARSWEVCKT